MGITQRDLANAINVPYQRINEIINGRATQNYILSSMLKGKQLWEIYQLINR